MNLEQFTLDELGTIDLFLSEVIAADTTEEERRVARALLVDVGRAASAVRDRELLLVAIHGRRPLDT